MDFLWTDDLSVGIDRIDSQHHELISNLNMLMLLGDEVDEEAVKTVVRFLDQYVIFHFTSEEEYMAEIGYPRIEEHRLQHTVFIQNFAALKEELAKGG